jgi:hypothetical protein
MCGNIAVAGKILHGRRRFEDILPSCAVALECAVPVYRIYFLDGAGRIASATEADCDSDDAALSTARCQLEADALAEVWQLARCLGQVRGDRLSNS